MQVPLVECVPNFSCGRSPELLARLVQAVHSVPDALVLDASRDADHNRSVLTIAAPLQSALQAVFAAVCVATEGIDLRHHSGVHPRIGATDVVPFIPLAGSTESDCVKAARSLGERMADELAIPIFYYGAAAMRPERQALPEVRRGGYEGLLQRAASEGSIDPDCGPRAAHPSAGASALGVRPFLVAFNVNLKNANLALAKGIAKRIRASSGGLPAVRALGMWLDGPGLAQVSINLCDYRQSGLLQVFERVELLAVEAGVEVQGSELIGLAPAAALDADLAKRVRLMDFDVNRHVIENRIHSIQSGSAPRLGSER